MLFDEFKSIIYILMENRLQRWRLILGADAVTDETDILDKNQSEMDVLLASIYDPGETGVLKGSSPQINRWLGDIRKYFPTPVVQILQQDALERLNLKQMILEPELLGSLEVNVSLVATLLQLKDLLPDETRETARMVIDSLIEQLKKELRQPLEQAYRGRVKNNSYRSAFPRGKLDWKRTILTNLKNYQPKEKLLIPQHFYRYNAFTPKLSRLILAVDQSGSMANSVVHASIIACILAGIPSFKTNLVIFDTDVLDLTAELSDPISLLFSVQLGGGTHIAKALKYCQTLVTHPAETTLILISDLYEGDLVDNMFSIIQMMQKEGVNMISLLALDNDGVPSFDKKNGARLASMEIPSFACTPQQFPSLMAVLFNGQKILPSTIS
jgi:hypothetical protein